MRGFSAQLASLDFFAACTVEDLRLELESEWASLAGRHLVALEMRKQLSGSASDPEPSALRVVQLRWGETGEPLQDEHLARVVQRSNCWSKVTVDIAAGHGKGSPLAVANVGSIIVYVGASTEPERQLFIGSGSPDTTGRRPPHREEYRRSTQTCKQLHAEASRAAAADPDIALPAHWAGAAESSESDSLRLELMNFLLQHDCKTRQLPHSSGDDIAANVERMAEQLEMLQSVRVGSEEDAYMTPPA